MSIYIYIFIYFFLWRNFSSFFFPETLRKHPIDPLIQLTCKVPYRIPESTARINPKCAVLIPVHVLQTDNNLYPGADSDDSNVHHEMEKEHDFITDSEIRSFSILGE